MSFFFFFNDTATTEIYTLSLHDALPIFAGAFIDFTELRNCPLSIPAGDKNSPGKDWHKFIDSKWMGTRSEEHTSELQSQSNLVCRLLLEKKKEGITHMQSTSVYMPRRST